MIRHLLHVDFQPGRGLQEQVRETLVNAILSGIFAADRAVAQYADNIWHVPHK